MFPVAPSGSFSDGGRTRDVTDLRLLFLALLFFVVARLYARACERV